MARDIEILGKGPLDGVVLVDALRLKPRTQEGTLRASQLRFLGAQGLTEDEAVVNAFNFRPDARLAVARIEGETAAEPVLDHVTASEYAALQLFDSLPTAAGMITTSMED